MTSLQQPITDANPRCWRCRYVLAHSVTRPWDITCRRCGARTNMPVDAPVEAAAETAKT